MSEERRKRLDSIGFTWKVRATPISVDWEVRFQQLVEYKRVHGHCNAPRQVSVVAKKKYNFWCKNRAQKNYFKTRSDLTDEREAKLMAVGFVFEATSSEDEDKDWTTAVSNPSCIPYKIYS